MKSKNATQQTKKNAGKEFYPCQRALFEPQTGLPWRFSRLPSLNCVGSNKKVIRGVLSPVTVTGGVDKMENLCYNNGAYKSGKTIPL